MKTFYAYTRVSTLRQGERGVSLQEQRAAILRHAERNGLTITRWFEERLTAAKTGRPAFSEMLKGLRRGQAQGIIIHKIDRSARNLRDWADLGDLIDAGVVVHFANESIDLHSRGGRLSADIQAVVASDYVRNLREETLKGIRGRLAQGLIPFGAPIGYLNNGGGKLKTIDPVRGPLVRKAFQLYAVGTHTIDSLVPELHRLGLRNRRGGPVTKTCLSKALNNPFYAGVIRIVRSGQTYAGAHDALIPMSLFKAVQDRLSGRLRSRGWAHDFALRGLFRCGLCGRFLIGERQKGRYTYYRCHTSSCPTGCFREVDLESAMLNAWPVLAADDDERRELERRLLEIEARDEGSTAEHEAALRRQLGTLKERINRLVDAFVDGAIDKETFDVRKQALVEEQRALEDSLRAGVPDTGTIRRRLNRLLELAFSAQQSYQSATSELRRELALTLCSNRLAFGKDVLVEPAFPLPVIVARRCDSSCAPSQSATRTPQEINELAQLIYKWAKDEAVKKDADSLCA